MTVGGFNDHMVLKSVTLTPTRDNPHIGISHENNIKDVSYGLIKRPVRVGGGTSTIEFDSDDFHITIEHAPSNRKRKLLDAGFSEVKAIKILDILGEL